MGLTHSGVTTEALLANAIPAQTRVSTNGELIRELLQIGLTEEPPHGKSRPPLRKSNGQEGFRRAMRFVVLLFHII